MSAATCAQATAPTTAASRPPPSRAPCWTSRPATSHHALLRALAEAEFQHDLRPEDIERTLRRGHPGSANLRAALKEHAPGHGEMKSRLERRFRDLLIGHNIELPERNQSVGPWTVDCLWRERRVAVELDGRQHQRPHQADSDDDRDLWLRRHGYIARRYGKRQIEQQPDDVIADLLQALGQAAASVTPADARRSNRS